MHGPRYFSIVFGQAVYVHTYNTYVTHTWPNYLIIECTAVARGCFVLYCATISRRENACRRSFDAASGKPGAKSTESDGHEGGKREKREARVPAPLPLSKCTFLLCISSSCTSRFISSSCTSRFISVFFVARTTAFS